MQRLQGLSKLAESSTSAPVVLTKIFYKGKCLTHEHKQTHSRGLTVAAFEVQKNIYIRPVVLKRPTIQSNEPPFDQLTPKVSQISNCKQYVYVHKKGVSYSTVRSHIPFL